MSFFKRRTGSHGSSSGSGSGSAGESAGAGAQVKAQLQAQAQAQAQQAKAQNANANGVSLNGVNVNGMNPGEGGAGAGGNNAQSTSYGNSGKLQHTSSASGSGNAHAYGNGNGNGRPSQGGLGSIYTSPPMNGSGFVKTHGGQGAYNGQPSTGTANQRPDDQRYVLGSPGDVHHASSHPTSPPTTSAPAAANALGTMMTPSTSASSSSTGQPTVISRSSPSKPSPGQIGQGQVTGYVKPAGMSASASYPWSIRQLRATATAAAAGSHSSADGSTTPGSRVASPPPNQYQLSGEPFPFPRYGLTVPSTPTPSGLLLIFGGLVREQAQNDLFIIDCETFTASLVPAMGQVPLARVGHACALLKQVLIVWGGDTKTSEEDDQDEAMYLFNIKTLDWTRIHPEGEAPKGRYGHSACIVGTSFFVSGGQVDGEFMNDLWEFDMNTLRDSSPAWRKVESTNIPPPARTGHITVPFEGKIYLFGGTDGGYHYNDIWSFDVKTAVWEEIKCTGYIPVPREGHSASVIDGVIYIFGGRDVNGRDLGDLTAFKISTKRWFMFANMGPSPSGRSGHALASYGKYVFVLGGESNTAFAQNTTTDPSMVHVLDTAKIKYPAEVGKPQLQQNNNKVVKKSSNPAINGTGNAHANANGKSVQRAMSPEQQRNSVRASDGSTSTFQSTNMNAMGQSTAGPGTIQSSATASTFERSLSPTSIHDQREIEQETVTPRILQGSTLGSILGSPLNLAGMNTDDATLPNNPATSNRQAPPQRPPRAGDQQFNVDKQARTMSPIQVGSAPPNNPATAPVDTLATQRASLISQPGSTGDSHSPLINGSANSVRSNGIANGRTLPPADAFYYGTRSPTGTEFSALRPGSAGGSSALERELDAREAEITKLKRRHDLLSAIVAKAIREGYTADPEEAKDAQIEESRTEGDSGGADQELRDMVIRLRQELAEIKESSRNEVDNAFNAMADFDRARMSATEEGAYLRSRVAALESGNKQDLDRTMAERISQLEADLSQMHTSFMTEKSKASDLAEVVQHARDAKEEAEQQEEAARERAEQIEEAHVKAQSELNSLQEQLDATSRDLREQTERLMTLSSSSQQHETDRDHYKTQLEEMQSERDEYMQVVEDAQIAVKLANKRADDLEERHSASMRKSTQLIGEISEIRNELEAKSKEAEAAVEKLAEVETAWDRSRAEADSFRALMTGSLGHLVDSHRTMRSADGPTSRGDVDRIETLTQETASLRIMLSDAGSRVDAAQDAMAKQRSQLQAVTEDRASLRVELRKLRLKLKETSSELMTLRGAKSSREREAQSHAIELVGLRARHSTLRALLADHGIAVADEAAKNLDEHNDEDSAETRELKLRLADQSRTIDSLKENISELTMRTEDLKNDKSDLNEAQRDIDSESAEGPTDARVTELQKQIEEMQAAHAKKVLQLETDYKETSDYAKHIKKVYYRTKEDLDRQKERNTLLQGQRELNQGPNGIDAGSRTRVATSGRATPTTDFVESSRPFQKLSNQHTELQRRFERLEEEMSALREISAGREREVDVTRKRALAAEEESDKLREEIDKLQNDESPEGRPWEEVLQENADLKQENDVLTSKVGLLLEMNEPGSARPRSSYFGNNGSSSSPKVNSHLRTHSSTSISDDHHSPSLETLTQEMAEWESKLPSTIQ